MDSLNSQIWEIKNLKIKMKIIFSKMKNIKKMKILFNKSYKNSKKQINIIKRTRNYNKLLKKKKNKQKRCNRFSL